MIEGKFHSGEREVQARAGESAIAERNGVVIQSTVMPSVRGFLKQQNMVVLASRDEGGRMWASLVFGQPGFLSADDGRVFEVDLKRTWTELSDPLWSDVQREGLVGSLAIELSTRRRFRINGAARIEENGVMRVEVAEAFPACPKYITRREVGFEAEVGLLGVAVEGGGLPESSIVAADMFFVATRSVEGGFDVSHRGGAPGFVKVIGPRTIRWPEYRGNGMFNTLGNLVHDPQAGIVMVDFERGRVVQMTGRAVTIWPEEDGGSRFVEFTVEGWREGGLPGGFVSEVFEYSPYNPSVGG